MATDFSERLSSNPQSTRNRRRPVLTVMFLLLGIEPALAGDWSQFRGPNSSGIAESKELPIHMGPAQNLVWRTPLPTGHSSPVIVGNRVLVTASENENLLTICLDRVSGNVLWRHTVSRRRSGEYHKMNGPAAPTPVSDGTNVYAFFGDFGLIAIGLDGHEQWNLPLGPFDNPNGMGSSPILAEDKLLMLCDQDTGSFFLAVDKKSGQPKWRVERPEYTRGFSTPILYRPKAGPLQVIVTGSIQLTAYAVNTGREVWWVRGLPWQMKSTPVMDRENIYIHGVAGEGNWPQVPSFEDALKRYDRDHDGKLSKTEANDSFVQKSWGLMDLDRDGFLDTRDWKIFADRGVSRNAVFSFRLGGRGDMTQTSLLWYYEKAVPAVPSPLLYQNVLYILKEGGILTTLDPATGKVAKQSRIPGALGEYLASPIAADGKVFTLSHEGKLAVLKPGAQWEILAINDLAEECWATPAISDDAVFVRTSKAIYCFRIGQPSK
jgi:outer membrane protein assembly factor BamB